jgi:3-oxoacyl-[acyl-carrier protein] reductase
MATSRIALVTGGASGIGRAVVARLLAAGNDVAVLDRDATRLESLPSAEGRTVRSYQADSRVASEVEAAITSARSDLGSIDILVNCVGGSSPRKAIENLTNEDWKATLSLNLDGLFFATRAVVAQMKQQRWGRIVNVASVAGRTRSLFGGVDYTTAKGGVVGFSRQCAYELAPFGIAVNVVAPGVTLSERVAQRWATMPERDTITSLIPAGRAGEVDEVAGMIAFLCSESAGYVVGAIVDINGGLHIP